MSAEAKLKELGLALPPPPQPAANYVPFVRAGDLAFLAGHVAKRPDGSNYTGKLGKDLTVDQGYEAARQTGVALLSTMRANLGSLDRVKRVIKVVGLVNATPEFGDHPRVINGCSDLFAQVFGEAGRHARTAAGAGSLPFNVAVEIEAVIEVA